MHIAGGRMHTVDDIYIQTELALSSLIRARCTRSIILCFISDLADALLKNFGMGIFFIECDFYRKEQSIGYSSHFLRVKFHLSN